MDPQSHLLPEDIVPQRQQNTRNPAGHYRTGVSAGVLHLYLIKNVDNNKIELLPEELLVMEELKNFSICNPTSTQTATN